MLKIRRPLGRLIFNMGIAIPGKTVFLIETAPWYMALCIQFAVACICSFMMPCEIGRGFHPKQGLVTLPRFPQPLSTYVGHLWPGASFGARWYRIDIFAFNILWLYDVNISLSYFPIEFALWANYLQAIWLFAFCLQMTKYTYIIAMSGILPWCASCGAVEQTK